MEDATQFWGGAALLVAAGLVLFAPLVLDLAYTTVLLVVGVFGLAAGALLVGLSGRGRPV